MDHGYGEGNLSYAIMDHLIQKIQIEKVQFTRVIAAEKVERIETLCKNSVNETHLFMYDSCLMRKGGYLILDFGREICGRVHILFNSNETPSKVRVRLGESVYETCAEEKEKNAGNAHSLRDCSFDSVTWGDISTSESGFRFLRIDLIEGEEVKLSSVYAEAVLNGLTVKGMFRSNDERINRIFGVAENTISLCVRKDDIWDGIKRDRVMWVGDFYPELLGAAVLYGDIPQFRKVLSSISDFEGKWVNMIPAYSAWWVISLQKYYEMFGRDDFIRDLLPYAEQIVDDFSVIIKENGDVSYADNKLAYFPGNEFFIDWPTNQTTDSEIGWRYLVIIALKKAKELFEEFGCDCNKTDLLLHYLYQYEYRPSGFKQVTALGVLDGIISAEDARPLLKKGGAEGMTGFMGCFIIEALAKIGEQEFIIDVMKRYYGAMLDLGATAFWEDFDIAWLKERPLPLDAMPTPDRKNIHADFGKFCYTGLRHSLCHGWSAGFIYTFFTYVLGIELVERGYHKIRIRPHLCGLKYTEGKLPTPYGIITVRHEMTENGIVTMTDIPEEIEIV